jgi:predicted metal-binding membrane protein
VTVLAAGPAIDQARARAVTGWLAAAVVSSWLVLLGWSRSGAAGYLDHDGLAHPGVARVLLLAAGWLLMTMAMMVPASVPFVGRLVASAPVREPGVRVGGLLAGFSVVWLGFGVAATVGDIGLHRLVGSSSALSTHAWLVFSGTLLVAGGYQLSRTKRRSLVWCTEPMPAMSERFAAPGAAGPLAAGVRHGIDCVGSCGALMLVVFALGMSNLAAMAAGTAVVAVERRFGARMVVAVAVVLAVSALFARVSG